jgi:hypothetical protein
LQGTDLPEHKADNHEDNLSSDETKEAVAINWARIFVNVLQSFQFFLNVSLLTVTNGQGLAQMAVIAQRESSRVETDEDPPQLQAGVTSHGPENSVQSMWLSVSTETGRVFL